MGNAASDNKMRRTENFIARTITGGGRLTNGNEKFVVTRLRQRLRRAGEIRLNEIARNELQQAMKTLLSSVGLLIALSCSLEAKTVKFPEKDPAFSITLPDDWTTTPKNDGLECQAGDGSNYSFLIQTFDVKSDDEAKTNLPKLIQAMGDNPDLKDFKPVGEIMEMTMAKMKLFIANATASTEGTKMIFTAVGFAPKKGAYFSVVSVEPEAVDRAHDKAMGEIMGSITPISG
jgi:hypothetical protein